MRRQAGDVADAHIHRRLAEINRDEMGVNIANMHQGNLADRVEFQQVVLGDLLLGRGPCQPAGAAHQGRGCGGESEKITTREHLGSISK